MKKLLIALFAMAAGAYAEIPETCLTLEANETWIPMKVESLDIVPGSALDFSRFKLAEGPAGKYGRVIAVGEHFEFLGKPGVAQRFYGVNICFSTHNLPHELADQFAERLVRLGYNAVRYHHYGSTIQDLENNGGDSSVLNPDMLERLDYLHAALTKRGIYVTTDTFTSRVVYLKEAFPEADTDRKLSIEEVKMLLPVSDYFFENWKKFCLAFFGHRNPYTGYTYAEDPAVAWISFINENNFGNYIRNMSPEIEALWLKAWNNWLNERYVSAEERNKAWKVAADYQIIALPKWVNEATPEPMMRDFHRFMRDMELKTFCKMRNFFRQELGCKALFTDMNGWEKPLWTQMVRAQEFDYVDDHFYIDHPEFLERPWALPSKCPNTSPAKSGTIGGGYSAFTRIYGKPYVLTEYNFSSPGRFRGVGGIMLGCLAALQDWSGVWKFAYSHSNYKVQTPNRMDYFDMVCDPLNMCADRATICLYLRGDMEPLQHSVAITLDNQFLKKDFPLLNSPAPSWTSMNAIAKVGYAVAPEKSLLDVDFSAGFNEVSPVGRTHLGTEAFSDLVGEAALEAFRKKGWMAADNRTDFKNKISQSADGQLTIDGPKDMLVLNTPKTAGGYAVANQEFVTDSVTFRVLDSDATVWVSSLDDKDIASSHHLLLTHLTDLQNSNSKFNDESMTIIYDFGKLPYLVRRGRAEVTMKTTSEGNIKVWEIDTTGKRLDEISVLKNENGFSVTLDVKGSHGAQMMYEVVIE